MSPPPKRISRPTAPAVPKSSPLSQRPEAASDFIFSFDFDHAACAQYDDDEALARRMQEEEDSLAARQQHRSRRHAPFATSAPPSPTRAHGHTPRSSSGPRVHEPILIEDDELYARRLAQELQDAEIAMGLQTTEQIRLERRQTFDPSPKGGCSGRKLCNCALLAVVAGGGVLLVLAFGPALWTRVGGDPNNLPPFLSDHWGDDDNAQHGSSSSSDFSKWRTKGNNGLELTITNALTSDWWTFFDLAISNWNNGTPDALSLTTVLASHPDPDCQPIRGQMKVCNDSYGDTGWTGINEVYFEGGFIASSVAKMNEYYLSTSNDDEKHYVMCHEIGHGFGLPHRDEDEYNKDLGTCLDYTRKPQANLTPDSTDYQNLANLYGIVGSRRLSLKEDHTTTGVVAEKKKGELIISTTTSAHRKRSNIRNEEGNYLQTEQLRSRSQRNLSHKKDVLLYSSEYGETYETDLGDGAKVVTRILFS